MAEEVSSSDQRRARVLQFAPFQSMVDEGFWRRLCSLKLDKLGLDDAPIDITGFYAPSTHIHVPQHLTLLAESLPSKSSNTAADEAIIGNRNRCPVPGTIYNTNTLESFHALEKGSILKAEAGKIWRDILSGKAEKDPSLLSRFLLISFADLKRWKFYYWFAFPALALDPPATLTKLEPASSFFTSAEGESLSAACKEWRDSSITSSVPFFFIAISPDSHATLRPLQDFEDYQHNAKKLLFGFYDPCHLPNFPGWPLRNFLTFIGIRWKLDKICFFCYRESRGVPDLSVSLIGEAMISIPDWSEPEHTPKAVGWEQNKGKLTSRCISLAQSMDPNRLAISAADLNLKLMRWRMLPSLNLDILSSLKCLLFGAGTLGCQVARMLMAWGVRKITLVDNGRVAMSNPLRQSLYTFDNCLNGGDLKAIAAAKSLKCIFPAAEAEGVSLSIPMPGHPVSSQETASVLEDCKHLETLVASHDAIFLLTDTRESRWLPTLLCANFDKITITSALGFDNYLVMRHGAGPRINNSNMTEFTETVSSARSKDGKQRLGCYFCNDVVAPIDSTSNRTLDQQCTVTRPGLAPIASSIAVELLVGILHHPEGTNAQGEIANSIIDESDKPLGILPHQIRGSLSQFSQLTLVGYSSDSCTACSPLVVSEYRRRGLDFVLEAINQPTYLEKITGLTELMNSVSIADLDWDDEVDYDA